MSSYIDRLPDRDRDIQALIYNQIETEIGSNFLDRLSDRYRDRQAVVWIDYRR
jgi:hypothetical protein